MTTIREAYDPFSAQDMDDPYPAYRWLMDSKPVYHNEERDLWVISRHADVQEALNDWRRFSSAEGVRVDDLLELAGPSFLTMDPPRHGHLRGLVRKQFGVREIRSLESTVMRNVDFLLDSLPTSSEFDVAKVFAKMLPVRVICGMLGVPMQDAPMLKTWADSMLEATPGQVGTSASAIEAATLTRDYWTEALAQRRADPADDLLTAIALGEVDGAHMPIDEQVGVCNLVFEAGNATTGTLIGNAILALGERPQQRHWLRENPTAMPDALEEMLRWEAPVQVLMRVTLEEVELHGERIPRGARVVFALGAANRDPRVWDQPDALDLRRTPLKNLAFGEGIHHCLGAPLARLESPIALTAFLERFPDYRVLSFERFNEVSLRTLKSLVVAP